jgi:uncharacterized membrane protein
MRGLKIALYILLCSFTQSHLHTNASVMLLFLSVSRLFINIPLSQNNKCVFWLSNFWGLFIFIRASEGQNLALPVTVIK